MAQPEQEDFVSYLDYLLDGDLPEDDEDELDVDFAPVLAGDEEEEEEEQLDRDRSWSLKAGKYSIGREAGNGKFEGDGAQESSIFRQTRRQVNLQDYDIFDLQLALPGGWEPGDCDEGELEYNNYVEFLENLKNGEFMEDDGDCDFHHRDRSEFSRSGSSRRIQTRQRTRRPVDEGTDEEISKLESEESESESESESEGEENGMALKRRKQLVEEGNRIPNKGLFPSEVPASKPTWTEEGQEAPELMGDFSEDDLKHLYLQWHGHVQLLLQSLVMQGQGYTTTQEAIDRHLQESQPYALLKEINSLYLWQHSQKEITKVSYDGIWQQEETPEQFKAYLTPEHSEFLGSHKLISILGNPLTQKLQDAELDYNFIRFTLKGGSGPSYNHLLSDLQPYMNSFLVGDGEAVKMKNKMMLFLPAEDELLARGITKYGLQYRLIQKDLLPAKTAKNLKNRVQNLMHRCKGNKVKTALLEYRKKPLSEEELEIVREGIKEHGARWLVISRKCLPSREGHQLKALWSDHVRSNKEDKLLTEGIVKYGPVYGPSIIKKLRDEEERKLEEKQEESPCQDKAVDKEWKHGASHSTVGGGAHQDEPSSSEPLPDCPLPASDARGTGEERHVSANMNAHDNVDYLYENGNMGSYPEQSHSDGKRQQKLMTQQDLHPMGNHREPLHGKDNHNERWDAARRNEISLIVAPAPPPSLTTTSMSPLEEQQTNQLQQPPPPPHQQNAKQSGAKWCRQFDRIILNSVKTHGACSEAFFEAWQELSVHGSPFSVHEISARYDRLCQLLGFGK